MSAVILQFPRRPILLPVRASSATACKLFARRTVNGQAEEITRLAEVGVPVSMREEVDQSHEIEDEDCEEDHDESALVSRGAA